jgi:hypothetical protein
MGPQILVGVNPQKAFTNPCENGRLRNGVGLKLCSSTPQ